MKECYFWIWAPVVQGTRDTIRDRTFPRITVSEKVAYEDQRIREKGNRGHHASSKLSLLFSSESTGLPITLVGSLGKPRSTWIDLSSGFPQSTLKVCLMKELPSSSDMAS